MSITIEVSKEIEQKIKRHAATTGIDAERIVGELVEEVWDEHFPESKSDLEREDYENPFKPFIGMFSSGKTDTSTRYKEILRNDIKMPGGWGGDK